MGLVRLLKNDLRLLIFPLPKRQEAAVLWLSLLSKLRSEVVS